MESDIDFIQTGDSNRMKWAKGFINKRPAKTKKTKGSKMKDKNVKVSGILPALLFLGILATTYLVIHSDIFWLYKLSVIPQLVYLFKDTIKIHRL